MKGIFVEHDNFDDNCIQSDAHMAVVRDLILNMIQGAFFIAVLM
jgi:hypothetical protein